MIGPTARFNDAHDLEGFTDEQLEQLTRSLDEKLNGKHDTDLVSYRERKRAELREQHRQDSSLYERVVEGIGRMLGHTPSRLYQQMIAEAQDAHSQMQERYSVFEEQLETRREELATTTERHKQTQNFFMAAAARYERARARVDRLEAEVEALDGNDRMSAQIYEKREQLNHANKDLLKARKDADRGMSMYRAASQSDKLLTKLVDTMQDHAMEVHGQLTAFDAKIATQKSLGIVRFGDRHGPSLNELYETVGLINESMERFSDRYLGEDGVVFDINYRVSLGGEEDPMIARWQKLRSE